MAQIKCKKCGNLIEVEKGAIIAVSYGVSEYMNLPL